LPSNVVDEAGLPVRTAEAPELGAVNVMAPPATDSATFLVVTLTTSGLARAVLILALWLLPLLTARVNPWLSKAPMSVAPTRGLPRWSVLPP
jgi:hypothetical protein